MKKLLPIILLLFVSLNITAQNKNRERIKALKVSLITEKLDLSEKKHNSSGLFTMRMKKKLLKLDLKR